MQLVERDAQLTRLHAAVTEAQAGRGHVILVSGEAGVGKSALVNESLARNAGVRVLRGACEDLMSPIPLGPFLDMAPTAAGPLANLLTIQSDRQSLVAAALAELRTPPSPVIMLIEDLHWADQATFELVVYLGRRIAQCPALLLLTYRDDSFSADHPLPAAIGRLQPDDVVRLPVAPLSPAGVAALANASSVDATRLHQLTGGNAFFVSELLRAESAALPSSLREAVLARAARLEQSHRPVLDLAAVVPGECEDWLLETTVAPPPDAVAACLATGLLLERPNGLAFRHELARRAVESALSLARRRQLHHQVATALAARPPDGPTLGRLVHHAAEAGDAALVLGHAPAAADYAAAAGAHREAHDHLTAALLHGDHLPLAERARLARQSADQAYFVADHVHQMACYEHALTLARQVGDRDGEIHCLARLSLLAYWLGEPKRADALIVAALAVAGDLPPTVGVIAALAQQARLFMLGSQPARAVAAGQRALRLAEDFADHEQMTTILCTLGAARQMLDDEGGLEDLWRARELARARGNVLEHMRTLYNLLDSHSLRHRDYDLKTLLDEGEALARGLDNNPWSTSMRVLRGRWFLSSGQWCEAADAMLAPLVEMRTAPAHRALTSYLVAIEVAAKLAVRRAEPTASDLLAELGAATEPLRESVDQAGGTVECLAEAAWLAGDDAACRAQVEPLLAHIPAGVMRWYRGPLQLWLARAGGPADPTDCAEPYALEITGDWATAAEWWQRHRRPYQQALALAHGDASACRQALTILQELGAHGTIRGLCRRFEPFRRIADHAQPTPRASQPDRAAVLTPRQLEVLSLLAEGLQNTEIAERLFTSARTVDHHVSAILARLEARTRAEAVAIGRRRGLVTDPPAVGH